MADALAPLTALLTRYRSRDAVEEADLTRVRELVETSDEPWDRSTPLHVTGSAFVVHPDTKRVLLRWHERQRAWLHVGGHFDPGETDPLDVARREGREETGLPDLAPWPDAELVHVAVVPVPAKGAEPAHEHADLRFVLATDVPDMASAERPDAPLRWLTLDEAHEASDLPNVRESLTRVERLVR